MEKLFPEQEPADLSGADHISVPPEAKPAAFRKFIFFSLPGGNLTVDLPTGEQGKYGQQQA